MMTMDEFRDLLALYGADLSRWPADRLHAALRLTKDDMAAREAFNEMLELDETLRLHQPPLPDMAALEGRIMAAVKHAPEGAARAAAAPPSGQEWKIFGWRPAWIFAPSGGLVAAALIGFLIGAQPARQAESLVHPVYYAAEQIMTGDAYIYEGGIF